MAAGAADARLTPGAGEEAGDGEEASLRQRGRLVGDAEEGGEDRESVGEVAPAVAPVCLAGRTLMRAGRRRLVAGLGALGGTKCGMGEGRLASTIAFSACSCAPFQ